MHGVMINVAAVIIGSCIGLIMGKYISEKISRAVMTGLGLCTFFLGIKGSLVQVNELAVIASIVIGVAAGTFLQLEDRLQIMAKRMEEKRKKSESSFSLADGFVSSTLLFCVGSMAITGSLQAGISNDISILTAKSSLDFCSSMMLASSLGPGVMLAAISVLIIQGSFVLLAEIIAPFMSSGMIDIMNCVGSLLIVMIGTNLMGITKIKVADFLPAILVSPFIYYFSLSL